MQVNPVEILPSQPDACGEASAQCGRVETGPTFASVLDLHGVGGPTAPQGVDGESTRVETPETASAEETCCEEEDAAQCPAPTAEATEGGPAHGVPRPPPNEACPGVVLLPALMACTGQAAQASEPAAMLLANPEAGEEAVGLAAGGWVETAALGPGSAGDGVSSQASYVVAAASTAESNPAAGVELVPSAVLGDAHRGGNLQPQIASEAHYRVTAAAAGASEGPASALEGVSIEVNTDDLAAWLRASGFGVREARGEEPGRGLAPRGTGAGAAEAAQNPSEVHPSPTLPQATGDVPRELLVSEPGTVGGRLPAIAGLEEITVRSVHYLVTRGQRTVTIRLVPESLGELRIEVSSADDAVNVRLMSDNPAVRDALDGRIPGLRESLVRNNIEVTRVEVLPDMAAQDAWGHSQDSATHAFENAPGRTTALRSGRDAAEGEPITETRVTSDHDGSLDVLV